MERWIVSVGACVVGLGVVGCGGGGEPCGYGEAPRFLESAYAKEPLRAPLRFPAGGRVYLAAQFDRDDDESPGEVWLDGPFQLDHRFPMPVLGPVDDQHLVISSAGEGQGMLHARDICGRISSLEVEAVPAASAALHSSLAPWLDALPAAALASGHALLPGTRFELREEAFDTAGVPLLGTTGATPEVEGGLRLDGRSGTTLRVVVERHEAGSVLRYPGATPVEVATAPEEATDRIDFWRTSVDGTWPEAWRTGSRIDGVLVLAPGETVAVAALAYDDRGVLLVRGPERSIAAELAAGGEEIVVVGEYVFQGDFTLDARVAGEAVVLVTSGGVTGELVVRVEGP